ncbi:related to transcriptional activator acu-15 [Sporisorium reilianum SRZ2]|uniref:Related to transcriptional activator acu-15 n=1 Tax=Sporisorium reilianum (strain SRZ2) TaxID=999809 RepID=E6ZJK0_SPORE|nr:related to transcriptional activator acu-15 [Sporisorium reilianum SRZ2]
MYPHTAPPPLDAVYHPQMMPSTSNFPSNLAMHSMPSAYSNHDMSTHAADVSADTINNDDDAEGAGKRRRVQRACDTCRKKKVRCDGLQPEKGACTNCANYGYECTFVDAARKRAPPRSYVEAIEARIVKMEHLIASLAPGVDFTDRIGKPIRRPDEKGDEPSSNDATKPSSQEDVSPIKETRPIDPISLGRANSLCGSAFTQMLSPSHMQSRSNSESDLAHTSDDDSEDDIAFIQSRISQVNLHSQPALASTSATFDSSSSERVIVGDNVKVEDPPHVPNTHKFIGKASAMLSLPILEKLSSKSCAELGVHPKGARPEYWAIPSGFMDPPHDPNVAISAWPDADLADRLIDAYFGRMNREFPMINESQYRHEYTNQPELRKEPEWIALSFCIFMLGSHYVDDPRVMASPIDKHSRGMHWWQAAKNLFFRFGRLDKPLWRIQCLLLSTLFQLGIPISASNSWILLGGAIRVLLDVGAHRKHTAKKLRLSRLEEETYKRVFWVAYSLDRECAASLGRPIMLQDEDIDVELPVEIDDEYLFNTPDSEPLPAQPQGKPALISGFLCSLRLDEIVGRTLKTVYALHKTKIRFGINSKEWDERLVSEIDSALNIWLDTVPPHLRYDPHERSDEWLLQSSLLYSKYYNCQLLVHRPFIPAKKAASEKSILNFPSLAICTNAARSISHLVTNLKDRNLHNQIGIPVAFRSVSASTILLMVVWGAKRNGGRVSSSASTDLRCSIDVLRAMEENWQFCGKAVDILESVMNSTHVSVPRSASQSEQGIKRSRDGAEVQDVKLQDAMRSQDATSGGAAGEQTHKGRSKAEAAHAGSGDGQPLDPEARQLPLSTQQLASLTPQSSNEQSPRFTTMDGHLHFSQPADGQLASDAFGAKTPQATHTARMRTLSGASGLPASLSFGLMTPSAGAHWGAGVTEADYLSGPHSSAYPAVPAVTPSIFDNLGLGAGVDDAMQGAVGSMPDMSQFAFANDPAAAAVAGGAFGGGAGDVFGGSLDQFYAAGANGRADTPKSDGSSGLASYAFELLQNQSVWSLDDDSLNLLQQRGQPRQ